LGTETTTVVEQKVNTKPLIYTTAISIGIGSCACSIAIALSQLSQEWAVFWKGLASSFTWQFVVTAIFFGMFISVFRGLFWEKIDHLLLKVSKALPRRFFAARSKWTLYHLLQKIKTILHPLIRHRRWSTISFWIIASVLALPILSWRFNRPLDLYDISLGLITNLLSGLFIFLIEDVIKQKEEIEKKQNWKPPATIRDWERAHPTRN
jgi:hypothetical protein